MMWRLANALVALRDGVNARWPSRDKGSDGTIGNAAHVAEGWTASDHNPWVVVGGIGVVRAVDITASGIDAAWYAEQLRLAGANGDSRLTGGGYVIYNRRITLDNFSGWSVYTGANPHVAHVHCSFSRNAAGFDRTDTWSFLFGGAITPPATPPPSGRPTIQRGSTGDAVKLAQRWLGLTADGIFGPQTEAKVRWYQNMRSLEVDGVIGPQTWASMGL